LEDIVHKILYRFNISSNTCYFEREIFEMNFWLIEKVRNGKTEKIPELD